MRYVITFALVLVSIAAHAQNRIWSYSVGNWRNGPVVFISPLVETTEAYTTPQLLEQLKAAHPEFKDLKDIDVLRFGTKEEGDESRITLKAKYGIRKLEVMMMEDPKPVEQH